METPVRRHRIRKRAEIGRIMDYLVDRGSDVEVCVRGNDEKYLSRLLAVGPPDEADGKALLIEKLVPETGDGVIQKSREVEVAFWMDRYLCTFHSAYMRLCKDSVPHGHIIDFPLSVELEERRTEDRVTLPSSTFHKAVFTLPQDSRKRTKLQLSVLNYSNHGLGLLVRKRDFPSLKCMRPGDRIPDMILYGRNLLTQMTGIVRHKTEIMLGPYSGHFVLGVESETDLQDHFHLERA
jgi:hypothetical protein